MARTLNKALQAVGGHRILYQNTIAGGRLPYTVLIASVSAPTAFWFMFAAVSHRQCFPAHRFGPLSAMLCFPKLTPLLRFCERRR